MQVPSKIFIKTTPIRFWMKSKKRKQGNDRSEEILFIIYRIRNLLCVWDNKRWSWNESDLPKSKELVTKWNNKWELRISIPRVLQRMRRWCIHKRWLNWTIWTHTSLQSNLIWDSILEMEILMHNSCLSILQTSTPHKQKDRYMVKRDQSRLRDLLQAQDPHLPEAC